MSGQLFGFLPLIHLPESFAHAYPGIVDVHMMMVLLGTIMLLYAICLFIWFLLLCSIRSPKQEARKAGKEGLWSFLWAFVLGIFGLYALFFVPVAIGAMGYRQYS